MECIAPHGKVHSELETLLLNVMKPLGESGKEITNNILQFVDNTNVGALGAVGLGVLLYTAISMVMQIEVAFNATWRVRHSRSLIKRFCHYISVLPDERVVAVLGTVESHAMDAIDGMNLKQLAGEESLM